MAISEKAIEIMERLAQTAEKVRGSLEPHVAQIEEEGSTDEDIDQANRLNDVLEEAYTALDGIFKQINRIHGYGPDMSDSEEVDEEVEDEPEGMPTTHRAILKFLYENPEKRLEDMRREIPEASELSGSIFTQMRKDIADNLAEQGVVIEFDHTGKTRGTKYYIHVTEGHDIFHNIIYPEVTEETSDNVEGPEFETAILEDEEQKIEVDAPLDEPSVLDFPVELPAEVIPVPESVDETVIEPDILGPVPIIDSQYPEFLNSSTKLVPDEELIDIVKTNGRLHIKNIIESICGRTSLHPADFTKLRYQLDELASYGNFLVDGNFFEVEGYVPPKAPEPIPKPIIEEPDPEIESNDPDFEAMISSAQVRRPANARKPRDRGRWEPYKR